MSLSFKKIRNEIKRSIRRIPIPLSKNHRYDLETKKIINKTCNKYSNCIDVGSHLGEVLDYLIKHSPQGNHFGFEPLPSYYDFLKKKYLRFSKIKIYDIALCDSEGITEFNHVITNPAYSGIKKRNYDRGVEKDETIKVKKNRLDSIIPSNTPITFIKIDVEGGEMGVLEGAVNIIKRDSPIIVFEFGVGASDIYGTDPQKMFAFFTGLGYEIFLLTDFIQNRKPLNFNEFSDQYYNKLNYYFIAFKI